ncbi:MAG: TolC family protein [Bacteroidia bacterium]|nr:TolC family protein [Bacteroidia bacterium]
MLVSNKSINCQQLKTLKDSLKLQLENPKINLNMSMIDTNAFDINKDIDEQLISLDSILYYVSENSANLKMAIAETMKFKYNRKYISWIWLNAFQLFYNYGYGNQVNNIISSNQTADLATQSLGLGYRVGINFVLPMGDFIGRSARLKSLHFETEIARHKQDEARRLYKRLIIEDYFILISNQKLLFVKSQDLETSRISAEVALIEMRRGKTQPSELGRMRNIMAIAEINFEQARRDFLSSYYKLETTLAVPLTTFKKREVSKP